MLAKVGPVAFALALAPALVAAQSGSALGDAFDPLAFDVATFLAPGAALAAAPPTAGSVAFPPQRPDMPSPGLLFSMRSPIRHQLGEGLEVDLQLHANGLVLTQDENGDSLELALLLDGEAVPDGATRLALSRPFLAPGEEDFLTVTLQAPSTTFPKNATLALRIRPLMPALASDALVVVLGPSRATFLAMRAPTLADLELQEGDLRQIDLRHEAFVPSDGGVVHVVSVSHDAVHAPIVADATARRVYLLVRGDEPADEARAAHAFPDRERRLAAAHELRVGSALVRAHPGVGVIVPITRSVDITCARNCPADFRASVVVANASAPTGPTLVHDPGSVLVPPPPATSGIPVSKDKPEDKKGLPGPPLALTLGLALALALALSFARRRRGL